jgi:hypothetical protein
VEPRHALRARTRTDDLNTIFFRGRNAHARQRGRHDIDLVALSRKSNGEIPNVPLFPPEVGWVELGEHQDPHVSNSS